MSELAVILRGGRSAGRLAAGCVFLCLLVAMVFWPVRRHDFVNFDDPDYVVENLEVKRGLSAGGLRWAFTATHAANWHPLTWLSHMADVEMFGMRPASHHLANLGLHLLATAILFLVLRKMTGATGPSFLVAGLFGVHPLHVESVAWVAERKDVLSGMLFLLTILAYVGYLRRPGSGRYLAVMGFFGLALLAKPMVVTLPFVLLLLDWWPLGRSGTGGGARGASLRKLTMEKVPLFIFAAASSLVTFLAQSRWGAVGSLEKRPLWARAVNAVVSYVSYLKKAVWPSGLAVFYPHPGRGIALWKVTASAIVLTALTAGTVMLRRREPYLLTGWLWYLGMLVPVIGLVQVGTQGMADRYTYLPLIGLFAACVWGAARLATGRQAGRWAALVGMGVLLALSIAARRQLGFWRDSEVLFRHSLEVTGPYAGAYNNMGNVLLGRGEHLAALGCFSKALEMNPGDPLILSNIGLSLAGSGRLAEAEGYCRKALELKPEFPDAANNLGMVLARLRRDAEAEEQFLAALRHRPKYPEALLNLGGVLWRLGRVEEAVARTREALRLRPDLAMGHNNLGVYYRAQGKKGEALEEFREALRLDPGCVEARENLTSDAVPPPRSLD